MSKTSLITGVANQPAHARTTAGTEKSQVVLIGKDGSDNLVDIEALLTALTAKFPTALGIGGGLKVEGSAGENCKTWAVQTAVIADFIKASPGVVTGMEWYNLSPDDAFVRLYNKTSAPLIGDTPVWHGVIPAKGTGGGAGGFVRNFLNGLDKFPAGIAIRVTRLSADTDATTMTSPGIIGNVEFI